MGGGHLHLQPCAGQGVGPLAIKMSYNKTPPASRKRRWHVALARASTSSLWMISTLA